MANLCDGGSASRLSVLLPLSQPKSAAHALAAINSGRLAWVASVLVVIMMVSPGFRAALAMVGRRACETGILHCDGQPGRPGDAGSTLGLTSAHDCEIWQRGADCVGMKFKFVPEEKGFRV